MHERLTLYVGTYTAKGAEGIHALDFDTSSGRLTHDRLVAAVSNPTFLALHPRGDRLYAVSEVRDATGRHGGAVNAFAIAPETGALTLLDRQSSEGAGPCHLSVDRTGRFAFVANYHSGGVAMLPIGTDGRLDAACAVIQHHGCGPDPERQEGPHAHSITLSPDERFAIVADLGLDKLMVYRIDWRAGRLLPHEPPFTAVAPGAGPRHLAFHPTARFAYVINELDNTMTALTWDAAQGACHVLQTLPTEPAEFAGTGYAADVQMSADGHFLYGSNRGHDSVAVFAVDDRDGTLAPRAVVPTGGAWPRNIALDPTGAFLLAANQESDSITVFRRDPVTGHIAPTGHAAHVSMPVCLKFR